MARWVTKRKRRVTSRASISAFLLTAILVFCGAPKPLFAQSSSKHAFPALQLPVSEGPAASFKHLSIKDGLSQTRVEQIVQDDQGFMWFGTQYGLNRFDGYTYRVFTNDPSNPNSLGGVYVRFLFKDRDGKLWISCNKSLDRFDPVTETFTHIHLAPLRSATVEPTITDIAQDSSGTLWLSSADGLYKLSSKGQFIARYNHVPDDKLSLSSNEVESVSEDREGRLWVATRNGFNVLDSNTGRVKHFISIPESYLGLLAHEDRHGNFWILFGPNRVIGLLNRADYTVTRLQPQTNGVVHPADESITAMLEDRDGVMWFGTMGSGLLKYDAPGRRFIQYRNQPGDPDSLGADRVTTLFQDRDGTLWVGHHQTEPSFFSTSKYPFESFKWKIAGANSLISNLTTSIFKDSNGALWIGSTGVLQKFDRRTGNSTVIPGPLKGTDTLSILQDQNRSFWFGTTNHGIVRTDEQQKIREVYRNRVSDSTTIASDLVARLLFDRSGTLWAATWDGLSRFDAERGTFESFRRDPEGGSENYLAIAEGPNGMIWLGSAKGLERFDPMRKTFKLYSHRSGTSQGLSDSRVNAILFDRLGRAWIGTQNGLDILDPKTEAFTEFTTRDGLSGNVVSCILDDDHGHMWMSTNHGVTRVDAASNTFSTFGTEDGLPGGDLTGWGACSKASDGEMFFGGFSGATAFWPDRVAKRPIASNVRLTEFRVGGVPIEPTANGILNKAINFTDSVTLEHSQANFALSFASLNFEQGGEARYRYRLAGLDPTWTEAGPNRTAAFTTLPAGSYTFEVQVATGTGTWIEPGARVAITVRPAWWNSWSFRLGCVAAIVIALVQFYRYRLNEVSQDLKIRLEERLRERTRIARELHDTLLQSFQGLILSFHAAVKGISREEPARQTMERILDEAQRAILDGRNSLMDLRSGYEPSHGLEGPLRLLVDGLRASSDATIGLLMKGTFPDVSEKASREVLAIAKEALMNALIHAGASEIEVYVTQSPSGFLLRVRDNGCGISPLTLKPGGLTGHYGIVGMRERAQQIGGVLSVSNRPDSGTEVLLQASFDSPGSDHPIWWRLRKHISRLLLSKR